MKIAIGSDHAGFALKQHLGDALRQKGHEVTDFGTNSAESTDYPDYAAAVARAVQAGEAERGILICFTGIGMSITANKIKGIRAALGANLEDVRLSRAHNNANVLTMGARTTDETTAVALSELFLATGFDGGRHARRVNKIMALEEDVSKP